MDGFGKSYSDFMQATEMKGDFLQLLEALGLQYTHFLVR